MLKLLRTGLGVLVFVAIGWQMRIALQIDFSMVSFVSYFTNIANVLAAGVLIAAGTQRQGTQSPTIDLLRNAVVIYMTVVGVVFVTLLRNVDLGALLPWINILLHYVMPVAVVADWLIDPPARRLTMREVAMALLFPLLYLGYTMLRGASTGWYPYPFLNPALVGGYGAVALYALAIIGVFSVTGWLLTLRR